MDPTSQSLISDGLLNMFAKALISVLNCVCTQGMLPINHLPNDDFFLSQVETFTDNNNLSK